MSEEVKETESKPEETAETVEAPEAAEAPAEQAAVNKVKKINNLSKDALNKKIAEFEDKGQVRSKYYKHLKIRKEELGA